MGPRVWYAKLSPLLISLLCLFSLIPTIHSLLDLLFVAPWLLLFLFLVLLSKALCSRIFLLNTIHLQSKFLFEILHQLLLWRKDRVVFSEADPARVVTRFEKLRASLSENLETVYFRWVVVDLGRDYHRCREVFEEYVRQIAPKEASIQIDIATATRYMSVREISVFTPRTINLYPACSLLVCHPKGEQLLSVTMYPWTEAIQTI